MPNEQAVDDKGRNHCQRNLNTAIKDAKRDKAHELCLSSEMLSASRHNFSLFQCNGTNISDTVINAIKRHVNIQRLRIDLPSDAFANAISPILNHHPSSISSLHINCWEGQQGICKILEALKTNSTVESLELFRGEMDQELANKLAELFTVNPNIQSFDYISKNNFLEELPFFKNIFIAMTKLPMLRKVKLLHMNLSSIFDDLSNLLKHSQTIKTLELRFCLFKDKQELECFAQAISVNTSLEELYLEIVPYSNSKEERDHGFFYGLKPELQSILNNAVASRLNLKVSGKTFFPLVARRRSREEMEGRDAVSSAEPAQRQRLSM